jgi:hypothetical protein
MNNTLNDQSTSISQRMIKHLVKTQKRKVVKISKINILLQVNFEDMTYYSTDKKGFLKRQLAPSITIDYCNSSKQTTLHLIIEKIQVLIRFTP